MKTTKEEVMKIWMREDMVNHPDHYTRHKWEVIDILEEFFGDDPLLWQVGKYTMRYKYKKNPLEDLKKAEYYLKRKISNLEKDINESQASHTTDTTRGN